jgi:hypothetical protein
MGHYVGDMLRYYHLTIETLLAHLRLRLNTYVPM